MSKLFTPAEVGFLLHVLYDNQIAFPHDFSALRHRVRAKLNSELVSDE